MNPLALPQPAGLQPCRRKTLPVTVGPIVIGGAAPITVQSMTKTDTHDRDATTKQIRRLIDAGCDLIRVAIPDHEAVEQLPHYVRSSKVPLIADIHFDHRLALAAMRAGAPKIRINPGNIGSRQAVTAVVATAQELGVALRIGVNAGSLNKSLLRKYGKPTPQAMVESVSSQISIMQDLDFHQYVIAAKSSSVLDTIAANRALANLTDHPLHLGVTEAGLNDDGLIKSSLALGALLLEGIGDTIRISLTGDPVPEVTAGLTLLRELGLRSGGARLISCPTCGRCRVDLYRAAQAVRERLQSVQKPITVAVMGCEVNGPGEARGADLGLAFSRDKALIFVHGKALMRVNVEDAVAVLFDQIARYEG